MNSNLIKFQILLICGFVFNAVIAATFRAYIEIPVEREDRILVTLSNTPPKDNPKFHFPKENSNEPSLHEYHPTTSNRPMTAKNGWIYKTYYQTSTTPLPAHSYETSTSHRTLTNDLFHQFSTKLYQNLSPKFNNQNLISSPFSLQDLLALLYLGADGKTAQQLQRVVNLPDSKTILTDQFKSTLKKIQSDSEDFKLKLANKLYFKDDLTVNSSFAASSQNDFDTELEPISFKSTNIAANTINQWVAYKTEERIKNIINPQSLDADTEAILINAIYMKAKWEKEFSTTDTLKMDFYKKNDMKHVIPVDMMYIEDDFKYGNFPELKASFVVLPFLGSELSMLIIIPDEIEGLHDVQNHLKNKNLNDFVARMEERKLTVRMPKFKIETEVDLKKPLEELGITNIFTNNAEFPNLFKNQPNVKISQILQKAYINVNEGGVEAAAASFSQIVPLSLQPNMIYVTADHPFMFAVISEDAVFFMGHVIDNFQ